MLLEQSNEEKLSLENELALERAKYERLKVEIVRLQAAKARADAQPKMILTEHKLFIKTNIGQLNRDERAGLFEILKELITEEQRRMGQFQFNLDILSQEHGLRLHAYVSKCLKKRTTKTEFVDALYESLSLEQLADLTRQNPSVLMKLSECKRRALN